jgi:sugar phosphate isomerase/epimerase
VRIALENLTSAMNFERLSALFAEFPVDYLGFCYDTGHGNMVAGWLDHLEALKDRLIALHVHDNDGIGDEHKLPFAGNVDWQRFMRIVKESEYDKPLNLESNIARHPELSEAAFLSQALAACSRLVGLAAA